MPDGMVQAGVTGRAGFTEFMGLHLVEASGARVVGWLVAGPQHHQEMGLVHGGLYCSMVESLTSVGAWCAVRDRGLHVVGVSNSTDFVRSHRQGRLDAVAEPIHQGRTQQLWTCRITRASDGRLVAHGKVRLQHVDAGRE